jgi:aspartate kinase
MWLSAFSNQPAVSFDSAYLNADSYCSLFLLIISLMKVFKFGGTSISTADRIKNVAAILRSYPGEKILIVISAMGKNTNALEEVVHAFYNKEKEKALSLFNKIKDTHISLANELSDQPMAQLNDLFTEIEWLLHDKPVKGFDYYYDQVVCIGELCPPPLSAII